MLSDVQLVNAEDQWYPSGISVLSNMALEGSIYMSTHLESLDNKDVNVFFL